MTESMVENKNDRNELENPLVSVIVATYKRNAELKKAICSLLSQSYTNIEIVIVDDNAEAHWNEVVSGIVEQAAVDSNMRIVHVKNETNQGSAKTRNTGIQRASGEYICFLDDDDIYLEDKVKNQVEHIIKSGADYCITDLNLFSEDDRLIDVRKRDYIKSDNPDELLKYHLRNHITGTDTMMFKKEYLVKIGGFPPIDVGDEFYLMKEAICGCGKFSYLPRCDVKAYVHTESEGLSSGESKIAGENSLFEYKKQFFDRLDRKTIRYIKMRHFAVLAFAEIRRKKYAGFIKNAACSFIAAPYGCIRTLVKR